MKQRLAFALIMGFITTAFISFVLIAVNIGFTQHFIFYWLRSWCVAYVLAVGSMLVIAPRVQNYVGTLFNKRAKLKEQVVQV